jgi:Family of unknown function (DUF6636)
MPALLALSLVALAPPAAAAKTPLPGFHSPTGNIRCFYVPGRPAVLRCQIRRAAYAKRLTAHCASPPIGVDWGGFELTANRRGAVTCTGGVLYDPSRQVPVFVNQRYGTTWRRGAFSCASKRTGVTCRNRTGHGLFISRASWRVW